MSNINYGLANRQVVQDTRRGDVDPPVTEAATQATGVGAREKLDQNIGKEGRFAEALIKTAGDFGQRAVKEAHRQQKIEGAKLVADDEAVAYLNEVEPTFAEKIFGSKPKRRVAEEMQVAQDVNALDDAMHQWVEQGGFKEDTEAFQEEYDRRYEEMTDKYEDDKMKDLIAAGYSENLSTTRTQHQKAKHLYDQQLLRSTSMKGWGESSRRYQEEITSDDPAVRDAAMDKMIANMVKPEGMTDSAYQDAMFDFAMDEIAANRTEAYAAAEEEGVFDDITFEQHIALRDLLDVNQIKNDRDFNGSIQQLQRLAQDGNTEAVAKLAAELQIQNPQAVDSINTLINTAEAAATARAMAISENQRTRMDNVEKLRLGGAHAAALTPQQRLEAEADLAQQEIESYAFQNRKEMLAVSDDGTYPKGHAREGMPIPSMNDPITDGELMDLGKNEAYQEAKRLNWIQQNNTNHGEMTADINRFRYLTSVDPSTLKDNQQMLDELGLLTEKLTGFHDTFGGADLFRESFDNEEDYHQFQMISRAVDMGVPLGNALLEDKIWAQRQADGTESPDNKERHVRKVKKSLVTQFKKEHQERAWYRLGGRKSISNEDQLEKHAGELFEANLQFYMGDADRAASATMHQLSTQGQTVNNKYIRDSGNFVSAQSELTPDRSMEDLIALQFSDPDNRKALEQAGYPGIVTWEKKHGKWLPRLNVNTGKADRANYTMIGDNLVISLPGGQAGMDFQLTMPNMTEEQASALTTRSQNAWNATTGVATAAHDTFQKAHDLIIQDDEIAKLNLERNRLEREINGNAATKIARKAGELKDGVGESVSKKTTSVRNRATELASASGEAISSAANNAVDWANGLEENKPPASYGLSDEDAKKYMYVPAESQAILEKQKAGQLDALRAEIAEMEAKRDAR